jgi:flagellin
LGIAVWERRDLWSAKIFFKYRTVMAENGFFSHRISMEGGDSMIINHNISAVFTNRILARTERELSKSIEKLASGIRINKAGDDASGLAVSETLRSQIRGLEQAQKNALNSISFIQTAEGSLQSVHSILHRMRELAVQSANAIYSEEDRSLIQVEVSQLIEEIDRIGGTTEFNKFKILDGSNPDFQFQVGPNPGQSITVVMKTMTAEAIGVSGLTMSTIDTANEALGRIDQAVGSVSKMRASYGAVQNRLEYVVSNLAVASENLQAAESRIRDTEMASEIVNFMRLRILKDSGVAMLMQANLKLELVVRLLG